MLPRNVLFAIILLTVETLSCVYCIAPGDSSNDYFIVPKNSSNTSCRNQPCLTLEDFALKILPHLEVNAINMTFLIGVHVLTTSMNFAKIQEVQMRAQNHTGSQNQAEIQLQADEISFDGVYLLEISNLDIHGSGRYTLRIRESKPLGKLNMTQMSLVGTSFEMEGDTYGSCPQLNISTCLFNESMIAMKGCKQDKQSPHSIIYSRFLSGNQSHTITICSPIVQAKGVFRKQMTVDVSLYLDQVEILDVKPNSPSSQLPSLCEYITKSDIYIDSSIVDMNIKSSRFNRQYSTAIYAVGCSHSQYTITNSTFSNYTRGVLVYTHDVDGTNIILDNVNLTENSINTANTALAAVLTVIPSNPFNVSTTVEMRNCMIEGNADNVGDLQIIFLHALSKVKIINSKFVSNKGTVIVAVESVITFSGDVLFENNEAYRQGGALAIKSTFINISDETTLEFNHNSATHFGGAIYIENQLFYLQNDPSTREPCFYQPLRPHFKNITLSFYNNSAENGGDNVYGTSLKNHCKVKDFQLDPYELDQWHNIYNFRDDRESSISSQPMRLCVCDHDGRPQCAVEEMIFYQKKYTVYPGESFNVSVVVVGAEFGVTTGQVFANFLPWNSVPKYFGNETNVVQNVVSNKNCTSLTYSIWSSNLYETIRLTVEDKTIRYYGGTRDDINKEIRQYHETNVIPINLLTTPLYINVTLSKCPKGFALSNYSYCDCPAALENFTDIDCIFENGNGYVSRTGNTWIGLMWGDKNHSTEYVVLNEHCHFDHCNQASVLINLERDEDIDNQCAFSHSGTLCGGCKENYSIAIGSSHCIYCLNNDNLALLILFGVAGPLLYVLIAILGLTITQGFINGLLFYTNVVWIYQNILFPYTEDREGGPCYYPQPLQKVVYVLKIFMAWLNLDFGIEICFIKGLDAFWKSLLQYTFPIYIWIIAIVVIVLYRSINVQYFKLRFPRFASVTSNPVDVLATFILLSYTKLIRNIRDVLRFSILKKYSDLDDGTKPQEVIVWALDGNIEYTEAKHIVLLVTAMITLVVTLIYTIYILIMGLKIYMCECKIAEHFNDPNRQDVHQQYTCTKCHFMKLLNFFDMPLPSYNAHFASFNSKHRYWLGLTLLVRIALLLLFTVLTEVAPDFNLPILFTTAILLLCHTAWNTIHKKKSLRFLQSLSLTNLIFLSGGFQSAYIKDCPTRKASLVSISVGIALIQFVAILSYRVIQCCIKIKRSRNANRSNPAPTAPIADNQAVAQDEDEDEEQEDTDRLREPLLDEDSSNRHI